MFLEISQNSQEKTCASLFFNKVVGLQASRPFNFIEKETLAQVFSCEFCEICKNTFFTEHLWWLLLDIKFHVTEISHLQPHCVKSAQIRSSFWSVFSCIRTEYRKIRTRKNSVSEHFKQCPFPTTSQPKTILYVARYTKNFYVLFSMIFYL